MTASRCLTLLVFEKGCVGGGHVAGVSHLVRSLRVFFEASFGWAFGAGGETCGIWGSGLGCLTKARLVKDPVGLGVWWTGACPGSLDPWVNLRV